MKTPQRDIDILFALVGDVGVNSRAQRQLRTLAEAGYSVEVLSFGPARELPGVRVHAIPVPAGGGPRFFFAADRALRRLAAQRRARIYHASDLYALAPLSAAATRWGGRLVYDARELYPYVAGTVGKPWARAFWGGIQRRHLRRADLVLTVSDSIADHLAAEHGIRRPLVLFNAPDWPPPQRTDLLRERLGIPGTQGIVLHLGRLAAGRAFTPLIEGVAAVPEATLVFLGNGALRPHIENLADELGITERVRFHPPVPPDQVGLVAASADLGICMLEDTCLNHRYALPNKLFEYLTAGIPALVSNLPEMSGLVQRLNAGLVIPTNRLQDVAVGIRDLLGNPQLRERFGRNAAAGVSAYGWGTGAKRFSEAYEELFKGTLAETIRG